MEASPQLYVEAQQEESMGMWMTFPFGLVIFFVPDVVYYHLETRSCEDLNSSKYLKGSVPLPHKYWC